MNERTIIQIVTKTKTLQYARPEADLVAEKAAWMRIFNNPEMKSVSVGQYVIVKSEIEYIDFGYGNVQRWDNGAQLEGWT